MRKISAIIGLALLSTVSVSPPVQANTIEIFQGDLTGALLGTIWSQTTDIQFLGFTGTNTTSDSLAVAFNLSGSGDDFMESWASGLAGTSLVQVGEPIEDLVFGGGVGATTPFEVNTGYFSVKLGQTGTALFYNSIAPATLYLTIQQELQGAEISGYREFVVPGPVAGAGLIPLFALGGLVWARRRRSARPAVPA